MIDWEFYSKRRNINLVNLIKRNDIESYEQLKDYLKEKGVSPPEPGAFQAAHAIAVPPIVVAPKAKPKAKPATKAKTRQTRTRKKAASKKVK